MSAKPAMRPMVGMAGRPTAGRRGLRRSDAQWLVCILFVVGAGGFYAYKHAHAPPPNAIVGKAWIIDGDTVIISGTHIRLEGIDAPESIQNCTDAGGKQWACGRSATRELRNYIRGREIACEEKALDRYRRTLAICKLSDGSDINAWMVRQGWAIAYGFAKTYQSEQDEAERAKRGIWAGTFMEPQEWRRRNPRHDAD
jgi:endonuclease YncB( thermonuclease family)